MFRIAKTDLLRDFFNFGEVLPAIHNYNVKETDEAVVLSSDLPGVKETDIQVAVENGILSVRAQRKDGTRTYFQSWTLPETVDTEKVSAEYEDGVLTLSLPKQEQAKMRRIEVKVKKQIAQQATA